MEESYVLIVDDNRDACRILGRVCISLDLEYVAIMEGESALTQVKNYPPSLILLDLMMPGMDGFTVYSHLRGSAETRHIPVIVATAASTDQIDMLRLPGVVAVVPKNDLTLLKAQIAEVLDLP